MSERHRANAPGNWYIDTRCTDCSAARTVAPGLIVEKELNGCAHRDDIQTYVDLHDADEGRTPKYASGL